jgi:predicted RNA binding protein YcfA (HicA-like mRNA interferase family)
MPHFGPIKRKYFIYYLRKLGFEGPESGGKHQFMIKGNMKLVIPNPHESDISTTFLKRLLTQANISREEWEQL